MQHATVACNDDATDGYAVAMKPTGALRPDPRNPRTHSEAQIRQIAMSIQEFGWASPILADADGTVIAGHGRPRAARMLGLPDVPVITLHHLDDDQRAALMVADNQIAAMSGWDNTALAAILGDLDASDYRLDVLGFSEKELGKLVDGLAPPAKPARAKKPAPAARDYRDQYAVVVICDGEAHQKRTYDALHGQGYRCKVAIA